MQCAGEKRNETTNQVALLTAAVTFLFVLDKCMRSSLSLSIQSRCDQCGKVSNLRWKRCQASGIRAASCTGPGRRSVRVEVLLHRR